ncbi:MAG: GNAT family N-acetyltransferase [Candidatus Paceibacterota bacterium]|jgi:ribosomal protein S18 acetylase RimI-like enzyme
MEKDKFIDQGIVICALEERDLEKAGNFASFSNSLVDEDAPVVMDSKISAEEERKWLEGRLAKVEDKKQIFLFAEKNGEVIGIASLGLDIGRRSHIGSFAISIKSGYREIGLGSRLTEETIERAKENLSGLKIIRLRVFGGNKPAISLYEKYGFREAARLPKQVSYKGELVDEVIMLLYV